MTERTMRPHLFDPNPDPELWSNTSLSADMGRATWKELYDQALPEIERSRQLVRMISDLDRCPHGRHEQDECFDCQYEYPGVEYNIGNPLFDDQSLIGFDISGNRITLGDLREAAGL